jgi:hypothetical protein
MSNTFEKGTWYCSIKSTIIERYSVAQILVSSDNYKYFATL